MHGKNSVSPRAPRAHRPAAAESAREQGLCAELGTPGPARGARRGAPGGRGRRGRPARRTTQRAAPSSPLPPPAAGLRVTESPAPLPSAPNQRLGPPPHRDWMPEPGWGGRGDPSSPGSQLGQRAPRSADAAGPLPRGPPHIPADLRAGGRRGGGDGCAGGPPPPCSTARSIPTTASMTTPTNTRPAAPTRKSGSRGPRTGDRGGPAGLRDSARPPQDLLARGRLSFLAWGSERGHRSTQVVGEGALGLPEGILKGQRELQGAG